MSLVGKLLCLTILFNWSERFNFLDKIISKHGKHRFHYDNFEKNLIKIIKKIIRPRYGRLLYPYCQARLSHRLLLNKKMSTWQKLGTSVAVTVSVFVTCLCWTLGHGEQLLFSCVNSKVSICNYVTCQLSHFAFHMSHVICEMLMLIFGTC